MILSALKVLELNEKHSLLENLAERELTNSEGAFIDLRVGQVYRIIGDSFLGADEAGGKRHSPKTELVGDVAADGYKAIIVKPGEYYLVTTMERVNSPGIKIKYDSSFPEAYLVPKIFPRTSLQRGGVSLHHTGITPGWEGELTFGIKNQGSSDFIFELGARMFSVEYHAVVGEIKRAYSGQHQGGRVTSQGREETQI